MLFAGMYVHQKVLDDLRDRDVINIKFVAFNKEQEKVKRAFELWQFDLVGGCIHGTLLIPANKA